jgi:hypothetical protein
MIYTAVLLFHIAVACATVVALTYTAFALVRVKTNWYAKLGHFIAAMAIVECITGVALAFLSPEVSVLRVGGHLALYLGACMLAEAALAFKARRVWIG